MRTGNKKRPHVPRHKRGGNLILGRHQFEETVIQLPDGGAIVVTPLPGDRLGIRAPSNCRIVRGELLDAFSAASTPSAAGTPDESLAASTQTPQEQAA